MKHCKKCGAQLADDDTYCYFCGSPLEEEVKKEEVRFNTTYNYENENYIRGEKNVFAIIGFIFAFFWPIVGLVLSCIGLSRSKRIDGIGRGMAIGGIIVAILNLVMALVIFLFYSYLIANEGGV